MKRAPLAAELSIPAPAPVSPSDSLLLCRSLLGQDGPGDVPPDERVQQRWQTLIRHAAPGELDGLLATLGREAALLAENGVPLTTALRHAQSRAAELCLGALDNAPAAAEMETLLTLQRDVVSAITKAYEHRYPREGSTDTEKLLVARVARLAALQKINSVVNSSLDLGDTLTQTVNVVAEVTHADVCSLFLYDETSNRLVLGATSGLNPAAVGSISLAIGEGVAGTAALEGRPVAIQDGWLDPRFKVVPGLQEEPYHGMLSVPIILFTVNKLIGVLTLQEKVVREFTEDEIAFTETVSGQIAIAIENARLYEMTDEKLREKVTQLSTLRHVTASLVSTVDRSEALDMIVQHAMTLTGADMSSIFELDAASQELKIVAHRGLSESYLNIRLRVGEGAIGLAVQSGQPIVIQDAHSDPRLRTVASWVAEEGYRAICSVPLISHDNVLGGISVYTREQRRFSHDEVELLAAFANDAALAIDRARLYEEMERQNTTKSLLFQELNHRVKNNLQMMASLIRLQLRRVRAPEVKETLALAQSRIESLGAVHDLLAEDDVGLTTVQDVAKKVADIALTTMAQRHQRISLNVAAEGFPLGPKHATLLGLVLNELVCNALTHGLEQRDEGTVLIEAEEDGDSLRVCVADDGVGLPEGFDLAQGNGLGLNIVQGLVQQMDGDLRLENAASDGQSGKQPGTCAIITFPQFPH